MDDRKLYMTYEVINAIDGELAYVATLNDQGRSDGEHHGVEGQLLTLELYARKAREAWVLNRSNLPIDDDPVLHGLRKCAAIAIRALLTEGCPRREGF